MLKKSKKKSPTGYDMKIQILADDGKVLETIDDVHVNLKSQYGMGTLLEKLLHIYKNKYITYMYEKYKMERRSGEERRHLEEGQERRDPESQQG
jgi:ribosomal protein S24E